MKRFIPFVKSEPTVAVIRLQGQIANSNRGLDDPSLGPVIERAFSRGKPAAVALEINSPGGSPVQSSLIAARIRRLAEEKEIPVYAFVEDVAASGGYWLACAADEIFVDRGSIVGSIGVISAGFGAHDLIERYGVERRVHTAGKSKSLLDPFQPLQPEQKAFWQSVLATTHQQFIDQVKQGRGDRLKDDPRIFSGLVWAGEQAVELGLIDGLASSSSLAREKFDLEKLIDYSRRSSPIEQLAERFGLGVASAVIDQLGLSVTSPIQW